MNMYLPALVSCFGRWEVPNQKVIAVSNPRDAIHVAGKGIRYKNRGHVFVRFSGRKYMEEVKGMIDEYEQVVECDVRKYVRHKLRCRVADRHISCRDYSKTSVPVLERARYLGEVFMCFSMD